MVAGGRFFVVFVGGPWPGGEVVDDFVRRVGQQVPLQWGQGQQGFEIGVYFVFAHQAADAEVVQPEFFSVDAGAVHGPAKPAKLCLFIPGQAVRMVPLRFCHGWCSSFR